MNFSERITGLVKDTLQHSLGCFGPELILSAAIVFLLLFRLSGLDRIVPTKFVALFSVLAAFVLACMQFMQLKDLPMGSTELSQVFFSGLLVFDQFTVFFRVFLLLFLVLVITLTILSGIPDNEDGPDFYGLLIGSTIGMMLMASSNHLLMLFIGIEMTSVPSYAMVGFLKGRKLSSEAALKYVVYGAGAAGVMLYGISLLAGVLGTGDMSQLAVNFQLLIASQIEGGTIGISDPTVRTVVFGILLVLVGLAFKLSIVPFHFWCPDAFEGASAEVAGFLSVASKAGAFALLVRFLLAFTGGDPGALSGVYLSLGLGLGVVAAISTTFGNLAAYAQTNMKRMLAYSTIAHAGFMLMAVAALVVIQNAPESAGLSSADALAQSGRCIEGLMYYLAVYLFMNLGAFAIIALIRNQIFSEEIEDYNGLASQAPVLCICMLVCVFSLIGLPPFGGFFAKLMVFSSLFQAGNVHWIMWVIMAVAGLNTAFSLFYYLRILRAMFLTERPVGARSVEESFASPTSSFVMMVTIPVLMLGVYPDVADGLSTTVGRVSTNLLTHHRNQHEAHQNHAGLVVPQADDLVKAQPVTVVTKNQ